jgi:HAD superfamily hydrolase (TIGR01509 family)
MIQAIIFDYYGVIRPEGFRLPGRRNDAALLELIARLRPAYKTGLLSNIEADRFDELFESYKVADYFDATLASGEVGYAKPDVQIFQHMAGQLGVDPSACVMVDDRDDHCIGARAAGMQAIHYTTFPQLKAALQRMQIAIE